MSVPSNKKKNKTTLPNRLESGEAELLGEDMTDVKVHYDSTKPRRLNADAFDPGEEEIDPPEESERED